MKFKLLLIFFFLPFLLKAQAINFNPLKFDKNYWECENKWVVFKELNFNDSTFLGFIYLDQDAGYTEDIHSFIKLTSSGDFVLKPIDSSLMKVSLRIRLSDGESPFAVMKDTKTGEKIKTVRLDGEKCRYAIVPTEMVKYLGLELEPEWVKHYKSDTTTANYFTRLGFHLNHVGRSDSALVYLEKSYKMDSKNPETRFELAYAYNAVGDFGKAIDILKIALLDTPNEELLYKELGYAYLASMKYSEAEKTYLKGIELSSIDRNKAEMSMNLLGILYRQGRVLEMDIWIKKAKEFSKDIPYFLENIDAIEAQLKNQR